MMNYTRPVFLLIERLKECQSTEKNCDYLLEHDEIDLLLEYLESIDEVIKYVKDHKYETTPFYQHSDILIELAKGAIKFNETVLLHEMS